MFQTNSAQEEYINLFNKILDGSVLNASDKMRLTRQLFSALNKNTLNKIAINLCLTTTTNNNKNHYNYKNYNNNNNAFSLRRNYSCENKGKQKLLKYPALKLEDTLLKFLQTVEPLLTQCEMENTKKMTDEFLLNEGKVLQKKLEEVAKAEENWLAPRWLKVAYLQYRDPLTIYSNPGMVFPMVKLNNNDEFITHAAKLIVGMIKYKQQVDNDEIPIVKMGKHELDNSQFKKVYGTCRIPQPKEDQIVYNPDSKHVVVIYKHHFYKLPVYNKNCEILNLEIIIEMLQEIVEVEKNRGIPYGILSTDHRDNWAEAYAELMKSNKNSASVKVIQEALFTVSLDARVPYDKNNELIVRGLQSIHGGNFCQNGANRWMDKTIQLIVNPNGMCGFCYEHTPAEGQPVALMADYLSKLLKQEDQFKEGACENYDKLTKLEFDEPSKLLKRLLNSAENNYTKLVNNFQLQVIHFKDFGKNFMKTHKLSPDSFLQMAMQYAFYKLHNVPAAQYESAHLRVYAGGRTETIRSCSKESVAFAKGMMDVDLDDKKRAELLRAAVNGHREYTNNALLGKGIDRHLLGLKLMAIENNLPIPNFFQSVGYIKSLHYRLSTSQVASRDEAFMCYGPMVDNGYSCCYNPRDNDTYFAVGAWLSNRETCAIKFTNSLKEALIHMKEVLECTAPPKKEETPKSKL